MSVIRKNAVIFLTLSLLVFTFNGQAQSNPPFLQQIFVMKEIHPDLKTIGVMGSAISGSERQEITRAGYSQNINIIFGLLQSIRDVPTVYRQLVSDHSVDIIWVPFHNDHVVIQDGFEYLRQNTLRDRVGLYVPLSDLVAAGALASIQNSGGGIVIYMNERVAEVVGVASAVEENDAITYVSK